MTRIAPGLILTVMLVSADGARAEMAYEYPGVLQGVTPGWFCAERPDAARKDLAGVGHVNLYQHPFDFIEETDQVPSQPGIGIGVVAQLGPFGRDDIYMARQSHGAGKEQRWLTRVRPNGLVWLGYLGPPGQELPPGEWRFSLWRGPDQVFAYDITVLPADPEAPLGCVIPSS